MKEHLNQGTQRRTLRKSRIADEPKKKRLVVIPQEKRYEGTLVYPPLDEPSQNKLADELKSWALTTTSLRIDKFALEKGMNPYRFKKLKDKNTYFAEVFEMVENIFACKYAEGGLKKELDAGLVHRHLWMVDPEYYARTTHFEQKKLELAEKNATQEKGGNTLFIEIPQLDTYEKKTETPTE